MKKLYFLYIIIFLLQLNLLAQSTWYSQQSGTTEDLNAVFFINKDIGTVVGNNGTILRTINGGATWKEQSSGTTLNLDNLTYIDSNNIFVVGDNGAILKTMDGGVSWEKQLSGVAAELSSISFRDDKNGIAVGGNCVELTTTDGGVTWLYHSLAAFGDTLFKPRFVLYQDSNHIIIIGPTSFDLTETLNSSDEGKTWSSNDTLLQYGGFGGTSFSDVTTGMYIVNVDVPGKTLPLLYKTTNGGETWHFLGTYGEFISGDWSDEFEGVYCLSSDICFVIQGNRHILRSNDGGQTWINQSTKTNNYLKNIFFTDSLNGTIVGTNGTILHTTIGGTAPTIQYLIDNAYPGDSIYLTEPKYSECLIINKPIKLIGKGIDKTKIIGDTLKPVIIIKSNNVEIKNISVIAKTKSDGSFLNCSKYIPTNGMEILNSLDVILDSLQISGGEDISSTGFTSGGIGLFIENSGNINVNNSKIFGADTKNQVSYSCSNKKGGDGIKIQNCDSLNISNCEITGGKGGDGWAMGAGPAIGGYGGHSLNLKNSTRVKVIQSHLIGGIGGKTARTSVYYTEQAKAGDGAYCDSSNASFQNSTLEGGTASILSPPSVPLNTLGGNGITVVNYSNVIVNGGTLIRGSSSEDAMGKLYYSDSTSSINFTNIIVNTTVSNLICSLEKRLVKLVWDTVIGLNFMQFEIEKKSDENDWITLAIIKDTSQSVSYTDTIFTIPAKNLEYRIKIVNLDSSFSYSETKLMDFLPKAYELNQNYPNPFNPSTTIEYSIPKQSHVTLKVFDLLGREVATLVNEEKPAGNYKVDFNGSNLSSGIYFYRMEAGSYISTKKLLLLK